MALTCLIVDDNAQFAAVARDVLERGGITVVGVASSGAEAQAQAEALRPDVTLLDIDLGADSGLDVARTLAGDVILISSHAERDFADLIAASPAIGFVAKHDLGAARIRAVLDRPRDEL